MGLMDDIQGHDGGHGIPDARHKSNQGIEPKPNVGTGNDERGVEKRGPVRRSEWNYCQATPLRLINPENPLRETVTAERPLSLEEMFEVGNFFMGGKEGGPTREINLPTPTSIGRRIPWPRSVTKVWTFADHRHAWRRPHLAGVPRILVEEKIGRRRPGLNSYRLTDLRAKRGRNPNRRVAGWTVHKIARGIGRS